MGVYREMSMNTPEQEARDLLERMEVEGAQSFSSGELVELANLIHENRHYKDLGDFYNAGYKDGESSREADLTLLWEVSELPFDPDSMCPFDVVKKLIKLVEVKDEHHD